MNDEEKKCKGSIDWGVAICCCLTVLIVAPVVIASGYSFYLADDFSNANQTGVCGDSIVKLFVASLKFVKENYFSWQGTYTGLFLQAFLSPLNGLGNIQLHFIMVLNILLFLVSLKAVIGAVCKSMNICDDAKKVWIIFFLCIMGIFGYTSW